MFRNKGVFYIGTCFEMKNISLFLFNLTQKYIEYSKIKLCMGMFSKSTYRVVK